MADTNSPLVPSADIINVISGHLLDVQSIIDRMIGTDGQSGDIGAFRNALEANMRYSTDVGLTPINYSVTGVGNVPFNADIPPEPTLTVVDPGYPSDFQITQIPINLNQFPEISGAAPEVPDRGTITVQDLDFTQVAPTISTDVPYAVKPNFTLPDDYTIIPVTIQPLSGFELPVFDGVFPTDDIGTLQTSFTYTDPAYDSPIKAQFEAWVLDGIANGGTGLSVAVEQAIFDNFRSRLEEEFATAYDKELRFFSSRGFTRPPGALRGALQEVHNQFNRRIAEANRDIAIKQADLAQNNTQFVLKLAAEHEATLRNFFTATCGRMLEYAKQVVILAIEQQNVRINRYNAVLKAYEVKANVYESRIRAMMLVIEKYKAELEANKLDMDIQAMQGQLYRDKLTSIGVLLDAYEKEMRGAGQFIENERNKIVLFQSQVEAFVARLGVDDRRIKLHTSLLGSDQTRLQAWAEKIRGYGLLVEAAKAKNDGTLAAANLQNDMINKTGIEAYRLQLARIESMIKNAAAENEGRLKKYEEQGKVYEAQVKTYAADQDVIIRSYEAQVKNTMANIDKTLKENENKQQALNQQHAVKLDSLKALGGVLSQLVASALSAIHASMQMGYSGNVGYSMREQIGHDVSANHNYTYCPDPNCRS